MSGNDTVGAFTNYGLNNVGIDWYFLQTDRGIFQLLAISEIRRSKFDSVRKMWLLVAMKAEYSNTGTELQDYMVTAAVMHAPIAWTKVLHGSPACYLRCAVKQANTTMIGNLIAE